MHFLTVHSIALLCESVCDGPEVTLHVTIYFRVCVFGGGLLQCVSEALLLLSAAAEVGLLAGMKPRRFPCVSSQYCPLVLIVLQGTVGSAVGV